MATEELSRRERQIMDIVYARGAATAAQVVGALPDPPSKTAIRTLMTILERKGHLKHREEGNVYIYMPTKPRQQAAASALRRVLQTFFAGSMEQAVAAHLADKSADISDEELAKLVRLIQQARKEGR